MDFRIHVFTLPTSDFEHAVSLGFTLAEDGATHVIFCEVGPVEQLDEMRERTECFMSRLRKKFGLGEVRKFNETGLVA